MIFIFFSVSTTLDKHSGDVDDDDDDDAVDYKVDPKCGPRMGRQRVGGRDWSRGSHMSNPFAY